MQDDTGPIETVDDIGRPKRRQRKRIVARAEAG